MSDVEKKQAHFSALLVHHVSRWGRFQDVDESLLRIRPQEGRHPRPLLCRTIRERRQHGIFRVGDVKAFDGKRNTAVICRSKCFRVNAARSSSDFAKGDRQDMVSAGN
jgi:hypothetical protein